ncbi:protein trichome birefringence-like 10 [Morus notabilis]|uniref:protein trichome birefringence-like 10 n=1 Tax=Morus notabilis TaxID=981085 RepID=UPI000CED74D6|nr:protein trichome birefringence-like 10 [Morus notabilis]
MGNITTVSEGSKKSDIQLKKFKLFNFLVPSLASLALFFVTLLFIGSFFYLNDSETGIKTSTTNLARWSNIEITNGSSSSVRPSVRGNGRVGFLEEGGGECDIFDGNWVWDENYPLYKSQDCPFVDEGFRCSEHGRPNNFYTKWRCQPKDCNLPRFDAGTMLEKLIRNKRVVFAGDSIARNHWESLLCVLSVAVSNKSSIYEVNGNPITKHKGHLVFKFDDFNCIIEYFRSPFLVVQGRPPPRSPPRVRFSLRVDQMSWASRLWRDADIVILSSGHWWTYHKTLRAGGYFQEGNKLKMNMSIKTAYQRSIETMVNWVNTQLDANKTRVFFRTYSPSHFRLTTTLLLSLSFYSLENLIKLVMEVLSQRPNKVDVLSVTNMTTRRKDGHPSIYNVRQENEPLHHQDCSHWCLPGVPDSWNELLYALLLKRELSKP